MKEEEKENMDNIAIKEESAVEMCSSHVALVNNTTSNNLSSQITTSPIPTDSNNGNQSATSTIATSNDNSVDIIINNVVCNFSVRCHLNLKLIAQTGSNVEFHKEMAMLIMKFRRPRCTASIWSSGKITMTGATTEDDARKGARRCARIIQKLGFNVRFTNYRVVNVLGSCTMPFAIKIADFSSAHPRIASYEPELHPGVTYKMKDIPATLKIFSTGSITITAPRVQNIQKAVEEIYGLVYEFRKDRREDDLQQFPLAERKKRRLALRLLKEKQNGNGNKKRRGGPAKRPREKRSRIVEDEDEDEDVVQEEGEEEIISTPSESEDEPFDIKNFRTPIEVDEEDEIEDGDDDFS